MPLFFNRFQSMVVGNFCSDSCLLHSIGKICLIVVIIGALSDYEPHSVDRLKNGDTLLDIHICKYPINFIHVSHNMFAVQYLDNRVFSIVIIITWRQQTVNSWIRMRCLVVVNLTEQVVFKVIGLKNKYHHAQNEMITVI
jgi:hypothetical protein